MKKNLLLLAIVLIAFFAVAEVALRLFGIGYPLWTQPDLWTGWRLRPNAAGWQNDEGKSFVHINGHGWRDSDRAIVKPDNTVRIAVLGDSFTEGRQVDDDETLTKIAEAALESCEPLKGRNIDVLNFGVSGFGTAQELLALQQYVWPYDPDVVVLAFTPGNDVRNNSLALEGAALKPIAVMSGSQLTLDMGFRDIPSFQKQMLWHRAFMADLVNHSRVLQILYGALHAKARAADEIGLDREIYLQPSGPWIDAWRVTETLIEAMHAQVRQHQTGFLLMTATQGIQADPATAKRETFMKDLDVDDLFYAEKRLQVLGQRNDFPVLALAPIFLRQAEADGMVFHGFENTALGTGHWNVAGHRAAGEALAEEVCGML